MSVRGRLPDRPILFFGGKGGVGKTTIAAAAALGLADRRLRTLLVSTDPAHSTGDIFQAELGPEPKPVAADCWAMELDPEREADRYIEAVKERIAEAVPPRLLAEVNRQIDIARVSPGAVEAATFDRFTRILEEEGKAYDRIVFDTAPTGQTLRLLSLPEMMTAWISGLIQRREKVGGLARMWRNVAGSAAETEPPGEGGSGGPGGGDAGTARDAVLEALEARRARFHRARAAITNPAQTAFVFVVIAERLPIWETEKAVETLSRHGIPIGAVVVNQVLPPPPGVMRSAVMSTAAASDPSFLDKRRAREAAHLARISRSFGDWPLLFVHLQDSDPVGVDALRELGTGIRVAPADWADHELSAEGAGSLPGAGPAENQDEGGSR